MKVDQSLENRKKLDLRILRKMWYYRDMYGSGCGAQFYIFGLLATFENLNFTVLPFLAAKEVMKIFSIL